MRQLRDNCAVPCYAAWGIAESEDVEKGPLLVPHCPSEHGTILNLWLCFGILGFSAEQTSCLTGFVERMLVKCDKTTGRLPDKLERALDTALEKIGLTAATGVLRGEQIISPHGFPQRNRNIVLVILDPV